MMGAGHVAVGTAAWAGTLLTVGPVLGVDPSLELMLIGALPVAGAALLPDLDHTNGTIANSMGFVTKTVTRVVSVVSGGHRQATHGLWFWLLVTLAAFGVHLASVNGPTLPADPTPLQSLWGWIVPRGDLLTFFVLTAFGMRAVGAKWLNKIMAKVWKGSTRLMGGAVFFAQAAIMTAVAGVLWPDPAQWAWLPVAVSVGHLSHLVADTLTTAGVPWLYPKEKVVRLPILGKAGSGREAILTAALGMGYVIAVVGVAFFYTPGPVA